MSITVEELMVNLSTAYRVRLIAGKKGTSMSDINWVTIVEDFSIEKFKNVKQIVFTACINLENSEQLLDFFKACHEAQARAIIINVGKYIQNIPDKVKEFCNSVNLPLYTIPWDVLMSNVSKDLAHMLIYNEAEIMSLVKFMQNIIFNTGNIETLVNRLGFYGFYDEYYYCPIVIKPVSNTPSDISEFLLKSLKNCCEQVNCEHLNVNVVTFIHNKTIVLIFVHCTKDMVRDFVKDLNEHLSLKFSSLKIVMCIGKENDSIYNLAINFKRLLPIVNVALNSNSSPLYYNSLGMYRILSEVDDIKLLKDTYNESIGALIKYDEEKGTNFTNNLKHYLQCNGNVVEVANSLFVHRNTVNNYLKKIFEITKINPVTLDGKLMFLTALKIAELYNF